MGSTVRLDVPPMDNCDGYEDYKKQLAAWEIVTKIEKKDRGVHVALSLPSQGHKGVRKKVFEDLTLVDMTKEEGLKELTNYMDTLFKKDDLAECWTLYVEFDDCVRKEDQTMSKYISNFDDAYKKIAKEGVVIPPLILAFKLLKGAKISEEERLLVITGINYEKKEAMYEDAKRSLKKFKCQPVSASQAEGGSAPPIKLEPTWIAEHIDELAEVLAVAGFYRRGSSGGAHRGRSWGGRGGRGGRFMRGRKHSSLVVESACNR